MSGAIDIYVATTRTTRKEACRVGLQREDYLQRQGVAQRGAWGVSDLHVCASKQLPQIVQLAG